MYAEPEAWHLLMETLSMAIISYLKVQIKAGAQAVQLFDSSVGCWHQPTIVSMSYRMSRRSLMG